MQFFITAHTDLRAGQAFRLDCMEFGASIHAADCMDDLNSILDMAGNRHWTK